MDTERQADDEFLRLNALVDGELPPAGRAALADRLAADREFARAHATLALLKATTVAAAEETPAPPVPANRRSFARLAIGLAASIAAIGGLILTAGLDFSADRDAASDADQAVITLAGLPFSPAVPDLAAVGLNLAGVAMETSDGRPAVVATYRGPRGCRLELRVHETDNADVSLRESDRRIWTVRGVTYELRAFGMPPGRFAAVSAVAEFATRDGNIPANDQRVREARLPAAPCLG
jgi:anti-sigma factor RsiW